MDSETTLTPVSRRDFDLDRLKRPMPFPTDPSDGIKSVEVTLLRLRNTARGFGRVTIEADDTEHGASMPVVRVGSATPICCCDLTGGHTGKAQNSLLLANERETPFNPDVPRLPR